MEIKSSHNLNMHIEHRQRIGELAFWKDELKSFNYRLYEFVTRWTNKNLRAQLDYYQNEFVLHGGVIEDLQETIEEYETRIARQNKIGVDRYSIYRKTY